MLILIDCYGRLSNDENGQNTSRLWPMILNITLTQPNPTYERFVHLWTTQYNPTQTMMNPNHDQLLYKKNFSV